MTIETWEGGYEELQAGSLRRKLVRQAGYASPWVPVVIIFAPILFTVLLKVEIARSVTAPKTIDVVISLSAKIDRANSLSRIFPIANHLDNEAFLARTIFGAVRRLRVNQDNEGNTTERGRLSNLRIVGGSNDGASCNGTLNSVNTIAERGPPC